MASFSCCGSTLVSLSRAAAKSAAARLRRLGIGSIHPRWATRAAVCETCPLRVVRRGVSYCGNPFLEKINRDPSGDGCGCPTHAKARSPSEHCPLDVLNRPAVQSAGRCSCKWCSSEAAGN